MIDRRILLALEILPERCASDCLVHSRTATVCPVHIARGWLVWEVNPSEPIRVIEDNHFGWKLDIAIDLNNAGSYIPSI